MVSIIIPVYNVEKYIDCCLESVMHQTYKNLEILIMEAKSTDQSLEKVISWTKNDNRVTIVSRKDGGLGPGRNFALNLVQGEYVTFLDSDDWFEHDYIERMLEVMQKDNRIDMAFSEVMFHFEKTNTSYMAHNSWPDGIYESIIDKKRMMRYGNNSIWGKMYRTKLFTQNNVTQAALPFEDLSVYLELLARSRKIAVCNQTYIHYRAQREGSLFGISNSYKEFPKVMKWSESGLKRCNMFEIYEKSFDFTMYHHFRNLCGKYIDIFNENELKKFPSSENAYLNKRFNKFRNFHSLSYWGFGSFTVRWIIHRLENGKSGLREHFTFTNLIAQMTIGTIDTAYKIDYPGVSINHFREKCLLNDIQGRFYQLMVSETGIMPNLFIVDFLYECHDVLYLKNGNYITDSELLKENTFSSSIVKRISWKSQEYMDIWRRKCDDFINLLKNRSVTNVILIENYFPQYYAVNEKYFEYKENFKMENFILESMYGYFKKKWENIIVYSIPEEFRYTDVSDQGYNVSPYYLNSQAYNYVAEQIDTKRFM